MYKIGQFTFLPIGLFEIFLMIFSSNWAIHPVFWAFNRP